MYPCHEKKTFFCERSLQSVDGNSSDSVDIPESVGCQKWGIRFHDNCFYFGQDPTTVGGDRPFLTFDDARRFCQNKYNGTDLATVENSGEQEFLNSFSARFASEYWIGLKEAKETWSAFAKWIDGTSVRVTNWATGQPPFSQSGVKGCVALHGSYSDQKLPGDWYVDSCTERKFPLCKGDSTYHEPHPTAPSTPSPTGCPAGWETAPEFDNCYKVLS